MNLLVSFGQVFWWLFCNAVLLGRVAGFSDLQLADSLHLLPLALRFNLLILVFPEVLLAVCFQRALSHERVVAEIAYEWTLVTVFLFVVSKVPLSGEEAATAWDLASERLLSRVDSHVGFQVTVFREPL